jgi:hypothetical protein
MNKPNKAEQEETKMNKGTPVYLRDLIEECQRDWIKNFSPKLKKAFDDGEDITVGYYLEEPEVAE